MSCSQIVEIKKIDKVRADQYLVKKVPVQRRVTIRTVIIGALGSSVPAIVKQTPHWVEEERMDRLRNRPCLFKGDISRSYGIEGVSVG